MKRRTLALSAVAAAVVIGAGTATTVAFAGDDNGRSSRSDVRAVNDDRDRDDHDDHDAARATKLTADQAVAAALRHTAGTPAGVDLDDSDDNGRAVWEVDVLTGARTWHEVKVDPNTGKVVGSHVDRDDDDAREAALLRSASTSLSDAVRTASAKGRVTSVELDDDSRAWEIETVSATGSEHDWHVSLTAGTLTPTHD